MTDAARIVCWFSHGAASAVATKLTMADNAGRQPLVIANTPIKQEHPDNGRFQAECQEWFGQEITLLRSKAYNADIFEVFQGERFLIGPHGAPCTRFLKKMPRLEMQQLDDVHVFGYTVEETNRVEQFKKTYPGTQISTPLIDFNLTKADCLAMVERQGIELPAMYRLGYRNNNCIGCVKGGAGYWNKIRVDFPDAFARMAAMERELGHAILTDRTKDERPPLYLDELPPDVGRGVPEPDIECSIFCHMAEQVAA